MVGVRQKGYSWFGRESRFSPGRGQFRRRTPTDDARRGPGVQPSDCDLFGFPGTWWQRRHRASYASLAPTMMMGSS